MDRATNRRWQIAATVSLALIALIAAAPLWGPGIVNTRGGGDSPFLLQRAHQMWVNLRAGVLPVRWMPDAAYGLGYPFFSYYAALPYYLIGILALAGIDLIAAIKIVQTLGFVAAALAMYGWLSRLTANRWAAWLAAVAYTFAPFHLVNVYVRGDSLSEFSAFVFYPLILGAFEAAAEAPAGKTTLPAGQKRLKALLSSFRRSCAPALAFAGLLLTHNLSAFIFSPFALLYLLILAWRRGDAWRRTLGEGLGALALGFLLSAWFWLPAVAELGAVQLGPSTQGYFHYSRHFRALDLVQDSLLFDYSIAASAGDRSPFAMGLPQALLAALGALALIVRLRRDARWGFVLAGLLLSTLMITPLSRPLWDHLPLLPVIQFPWRFLSVQALFAAAATAALIPRPPSLAGRLLAPLIAATLAAAVMLSLHPDRLPVTSADVTAERLQLYELFTENIGTTIRYEWLPQTASPRPFIGEALIEPGAPPRAIPVDGARLEATLLERHPTRQRWQVSGAGGQVAFPLLYWPGWEAAVDGEPVAAGPLEGSGYLTIAVPPGEHTVTLRLGRTPLRAAAELLSLTALVALMATALQGRLARRGVGLAALLILALGLGAANVQEQAANLTMDFEELPYLHTSPAGLTFEGGARLRQVQLSATALRPGHTLTVTLDWAERGSAEAVTVRLVSPAAVRHDVLPLAEATCHLQTAACDQLQLPLPPDISRGLYLVELELAGSDGALHALTWAGRTRGTLYLEPLRVAEGPPAEASVLAAFGAEIRLHSARIEPAGPDRLAVTLAWSAARPIAANYGISLRLVDGEGQTRRAFDTQPGYGFLPTSLWRPAELVTDRYLLSLPGDLPPGPYRLTVILYRFPALGPIGQAQVGDFALPLEEPFLAGRPPRVYVLPPLEHPLGVRFGGEIELAGYELTQDEEALRLTLWWRALQIPHGDYTVFVHLVDAESEAIPVQSDAPPCGGACPTSWWAAGEVVSETVTLALAAVPAGRYRLAVGLYDQSLRRLGAVAPDGARLPDDRLFLPPEVER